MEAKRDNPFGLTQSAHMTDEEIHKLWVDLSIADIQKITAAHPVIVKGGKGSGKTHLLRHHSFPLQLLRYKKDNLKPIDGIKKDKYLGIYMRCGGLNASRFQDKNQSRDIWAALFEYSLELLLAEELLHIVDTLLEAKVTEGTLIKKIVALFSAAPNNLHSLQDLMIFINDLRNALDLAVNNCAFGIDLANEPGAKVLVNRGKLIFGIPKILSEEIAEFKDVNFIYLIDELENFSSDQQKYVNSLLREIEAPSTIKIGVRKYGIKTNSTFSDDEEIIEGSEYEVLPLDERLRGNKAHYRKFAYELLKSRLAEIIPCDRDVSSWAKELFEELDTSWDSIQIRELVERKGSERKHVKNFQEELIKHNILDSDSIKRIVDLLSFPKYPLLEKVNFMNFYKRFSKKENPVDLATRLRKDCESFIEDSESSDYTARIWDYYKNDVVDQLLKENNYNPFYIGIDNFIEMSEGMPRNLINILKHVYDWAVFKNEPVINNKGKFSLDVQQKGVNNASEWCFNDMRKASKDLELLQTSISRLAEIFRINHYGDKPGECSLIMFGANSSEANPEAQRIIRIAELRSLIIRIEGGHEDKNSGAQRAKYQLNKMLCPRWGLPMFSRGSTEFSADELNIIFDCTSHNDDSFQKLARIWNDKVTAFGKNDLQQSLFK